VASRTACPPSRATRACAARRARTSVALAHATTLPDCCARLLSWGVDAPRYGPLVTRTALRRRRGRRPVPWPGLLADRHHALRRR
jgi:hypothetical protein